MILHRRRTRLLLVVILEMILIHLKHQRGGPGEVKELIVCVRPYFGACYDAFRLQASQQAWAVLV
jgi:hypothetical protein